MSQLVGHGGVKTDVIAANGAVPPCARAVVIALLRAYPSLGIW